VASRRQKGEKEEGNHRENKKPETHLSRRRKKRYEKSRGIRDGKRKESRQTNVLLRVSCGRRGTCLKMKRGVYS